MHTCTSQTGIGLSGNKVRKLQFLMAEATELGCDAVVTIGGVQSNVSSVTVVTSEIFLLSYVCVCVCVHIHV